MDTLCDDERVLAKRKGVMIMRKLVEGQEAASQLKLLLQKPFGNTKQEGSLSVDELVANVQRSFTESLSVLTSSSEQGCGGDEVGRNLLSPGENGLLAVIYSGNDPDTEECIRKRSSQPTTKKKGGRGRYKRRRNAQSWTIVSATVDDDHAWRKYGQKHILNSKFPRNYFRCSRKYEKGCRATKQVQRTQDNPEMYLTTYIGFHTCKSTTTNKPQHLVLDSDNTSFLHVTYSHPDSKVLINEQDQPIIKQEHYSKEEDTTTPSGGDDVTEHKLLSDHTTIWSDLKDFDHNNGDTSGYSCSGSQNLDMDFGMDISVHFGTTHDHHFHFDDDHSHELL